MLVREILRQVAVESLHRHVTGDVARGVATHAVCHDNHGAGRVRVSVAQMCNQESVFLIVPSPVDL